VEVDSGLKCNRVPGGAAHVGRVQVTLLNEPGSLGSLTTVIARNEGNIRYIPQ
jgi:hypothetical protein